jgi:CPA2 family monovalent cation:H+ antiporter-2
MGVPASASLALLEPAATKDDGDARHTPSMAGPSHRAIVVGHGPTGHTVIRLLRENGIESIVVALNIDTVRRVRDAGIAAV